MKKLSKRSGEWLLKIILRHLEVGGTLMTSHRPLEDCGKLVGDVPSATAILDRLLQNSEIIQMTGRSYRLRGPDRSQPESGKAENKVQAEPADKTT